VCPGVASPPKTVPKHARGHGAHKFFFYFFFFSGNINHNLSVSDRGGWLAVLFFFFLFVGLPLPDFHESTTGGRPPPQERTRLRIKSAPSVAWKNRMMIGQLRGFIPARHIRSL